jgi:radical SAM protein with 4Fe4S-binding SPASM domain
VSGSATRRVKDCQDPWTGVVVGASGDVTPCCHALQRMGNLGEEAFDDIWAGARFRTFRAFLRSTSPLPVCDTCFVRGWKTEPVPPRERLRDSWKHLLRSAGIGRRDVRLRLWADRATHRSGEPISFNLGLEAGRLLGGDPLDIYLFGEDPAGSRQHLTLTGRFLVVANGPAPLLARMEPMDFEWLELRLPSLRNLPLGEWRMTATLTPAGRSPDDDAARLALATCTFSEELPADAKT